MPSAKDHTLNKKVLADFERQVHRIKWFMKLRQIVRCYYRDGDVFIFFEHDPETKEWGRIFLLPTEYCFKAGVRVLMGDGSKKCIEDIVVGDEVITHRGNTKKVLATNSREVDEDITYVKCENSLDVISATSEHPFYISKGNGCEWVKAGDIVDGDLVATQTVLVGGDGKRHICPGTDFLRLIKRQREKTTVYNIQVEGDESFVVNEAVVHNCHVKLKPHSNEEVIVYARPLYDTELINQIHDNDIYSGVDWQSVEYLQDETDIPEELARAEHGKPVRLNTDPYKGSCVFHLARNQSDNDEYGESVIERVLEALLGLENLKNAQLGISSRNMSPKHMIFGEGISEGELTDLREQVDMSLLEPDFPIVTNYPVYWQIIGANQRLLDLGYEYEQRLMSIAVGLGLTREFLTGEGLYSGARINLQVLNTEYMELRETLIFLTEEIMFKPVAWAKGYVEKTTEEGWRKLDINSPIPEDQKIEIKENADIMVLDKTTKREPVFPGLRFNRLTIRDDVEVFDVLFQMYLKGSLDASYILDLFNIEDAENSERLIQSVGTIKDPQFGQMLAGLYQMAGPGVLQGTDILERIIKGLNLKQSMNPMMQMMMGGQPGAEGEQGSLPPGEGMPEGGDPTQEDQAPRPGQDPELEPEDRGEQSQTSQTSSIEEGQSTPQSLNQATADMKDSDIEGWWKNKKFKDRDGQWVRFELLDKPLQARYAEYWLNTRGSKRSSQKPALQTNKVHHNPVIQTSGYLNATKTVSKKQ